MSLSYLWQSESYLFSGLGLNYEDSFRLPISSLRSLLGRGLRGDFGLRVSSYLALSSIAGQGGMLQLRRVCMLELLRVGSRAYLEGRQFFYLFRLGVEILFSFLSSLGVECFAYCIFFKLITKYKTNRSPHINTNRPHSIIFQLYPSKLIINVPVQTREVKGEISADDEANEGRIRGFELIEGGVVCSGEGHQVRGKYDRIFTTHPLKRQELKCDKSPQTIPMTLFYDAENKRFLEKILQIEATMRNDLEEVEMQLGSASLNILNYLREEKGEQVLQIKLYGQDEKQTIIKFAVLIEKEEDDKKSTKTNQSSENGETTIGNKKYYTANSPKIQHQSPSENSSQKNWSQKPSKPPKYPIKQQKILKKKQEDVFYKKYQESLQNVNEDSQRTNPKVSKRERTSSKHEKSTQKPKTTTEIAKKQSKEQSESPELKLFLCQKELKQKQRALQAAKRTIEAQNTIITKYQQQKNKTYKSSQTIKHLSQIESLKAQLLRANLKISELETTNRNLESSEKEHVRLIDTKTKQANYYREMLQSKKIKIGNLMQRCFQAKEFDLMAVIQEELQDD